MPVLVTGLMTINNPFISYNKNNNKKKIIKIIIKFDE